MRTRIFLFLLAAPAFGAITSLRQVYATPKEIIVKYVSPIATACVPEVSESPTYSPLVHDVDPALFTSSNSDFRNGAQTRERTLVIGNGGMGTAMLYAPVDANLTRTSRALQANTVHYIRITCGSDTATLVARTANIAPGDTRPQVTAPIDPTALGYSAWPQVPYNTTTGVIDPVSGIHMQRMWMPNAEQVATQGDYALSVVYDEAGTWTNKNNTVVQDGSYAVFTGSTNDPIKLVYPFGTNGNGPVTGLTFKARGHVDNVTTTLEVCFFADGQACYGKWIPVPLPVGSDGTVEVGDQNVWTHSVPIPAMVSGWLNPGQDYPGAVFGTTVGKGSNVGAALTSVFNSQGNDSSIFDPIWGPLTHIIYNGVDYKGVAVTTGTSLTLPSAPSNVSNVDWTVYKFGFLLRKSSVGGTVSLDYAAFTPSFHFDQVPNGGSGGSKQCTSTKYHSGWRIGGPHFSATNAATNASPIVITTTTPNDLQTGQVVKVRDVPGNVAANGTWTITRLSSTTFSLAGSNGTASGAFPSDTGEAVYYGGGGLVWSLDSPTGHFCYVIGNGGDAQLYWINPDTTPADVRYLGPGWVTFGGSVFVQGGVISESDPELPTQYEIVDVAGKQEIIKGLYTGHQTAGLFQGLGTNVNVADGGRDPFVTWHWSELTPAPNTLTDRLQAFDPTIGTFPLGVVSTPKPNVLLMKGWIGQQNNLGWLGAYDVVTNSMIGLTNTWENPNSRACGLHTAFGWEGADYFVYQTYEQNGVDGAAGATPFKGPYRMAKTSGAISATPTDCATQFTALSLTNTLGVTGNQCTTITVDTTTPITPASANPASDTRLGALRLGDLLRFYDGVNGGGDATYGNPNTDFEIFQVIGISGLNLILQRDMTGRALTAHVSGGYMHEFCDASNRGWDYVNAPHGSTGTDPYSQNQSGIVIDKNLSLGSHVFTRNSLSVIDTNGGPPGFTCPANGPFTNVYSLRNYPWPNHFLAPVSAYGCVAGEPGFDGIFGRGSGNDHEKHPSPVEFVDLNPSFFDSRPFEHNTQWDQTVTPMGTYVFKVTGYSGGIPYTAKGSSVWMKTAFRPILDISGPSVMLADTAGDNFKGCVTYVSGECFSGSAAGDVYVNVPYATKVPAGYGINGDQYRCAQENANFRGMYDICVTIQPSYANTTVQYAAVNDPFNTGARRITNSFHTMAGFGHIETSPALPLGNYTINQSGTQDGQNNLFLAKIPPYPGIQPGINRATWIPVPIKITSVPAGTSTAMIRFGYSPTMYCASRQERCVANGAGIQTGNSVFSWETSDAPAGLACSSGCTITIPALSQRAMWSQIVYRNSGGAIIKTGPVEVMATP